MIELLPCPFCGKKAEMFAWTARCSDTVNCGAQTDFHENEKASIAAWNRRSPASERMARLEAVLRMAEEAINHAIMDDDGLDGQAGLEVLGHISAALDAQGQGER